MFSFLLLYNYYYVCSQYRAYYLFFHDLDCDYINEPFLSFLFLCLLMIPSRIFWHFRMKYCKVQFIGAYDIRKGKHLIVLHIFRHGILMFLYMLYLNDHHYLIILCNFKTTKEYWGSPSIQITQGIPFWWNHSCKRLHMPENEIIATLSYKTRQKETCSVTWDFEDLFLTTSHTWRTPKVVVQQKSSSTSPKQKRS